MSYVKNESQVMLGVIAARAYKAGELVIRISGPRFEKASRTTVQIGPGEHIEPADEAQFLNHSCKPNTRIEGLDVIASRDISSGEEITFDYNQTEDELASPFVCVCCGQEIRGKKYL